MHTLLTIIAFVVIFSVLVIVHELGHFIAARRAGIKVLEFGFGLPPRAWGKKFKKGGTLYSLNWIPFGGFVRLYGENPSEKGAKKSKESFLNKTFWQKTKVVLAGVFMNLVLAVTLLWIGYMGGIQPLITSQSELTASIQEGVVVTEPIGFPATIVDEDVEPIPEDEKVDTIFTPRLVIATLDEDSLFASAGVEQGDVIIKIGDRHIFSEADIKSAFIAHASPMSDVQELNADSVNVVLPPMMTYMKSDGSIEQSSFVLAKSLDRPYPVITYIFPNSPAAKAGLEIGDKLMNVDELYVYSGKHLIDLIKKSEKDVQIGVYRDNNFVDVSVDKGEDELIGVGISDVVPHDSIGATFFPSTIDEEVIEINSVSYPPFRALGKSFSDINKMTGLTFALVGDLGSTVFKTGKVPDSVAGPVGIAALTSQFVSEGLLSLLRFAALLSLSLAVLNLLPFPGLDGGRFAFILFEGVTGKKMDQKIEAMIHMIGFFILIFLILLITINDISRLVA